MNKTPQPMPYRWSRLLARHDVIILDCETTGTEAHDEIVELGAINTCGDTLIHEFIMPKCEISEGAEHIHGLSREKLQSLDARSYVEAAATAVSKHLKGANEILAYNAAFDMRLLAQTVRKYAFAPPVAPWRCLMLDYAEYRGEWNPSKNGYRWHKIGDAAAQMGVAIDGQAAHTAIGDCQAALQLMWAVHAQGTLPKNPATFRRPHTKEINMKIERVDWENVIPRGRRHPGRTACPGWVNRRQIATRVRDVSPELSIDRRFTEAKRGHRLRFLLYTRGFGAPRQPQRRTRLARKGAANYPSGAGEKWKNVFCRAFWRDPP